jgi:hypothetical protein
MNAIGSQLNWVLYCLKLKLGFPHGGTLLNKKFYRLLLQRLTRARNSVLNGATTQKIAIKTHGSDDNKARSSGSRTWCCGGGKEGK